MKNTPEYKQAMTKYNELINNLYKEPVDWQIWRCNITSSYLKA